MANYEDVVTNIGNPMERLFIKLKCAFNHVHGAYNTLESFGFKITLPNDSNHKTTSASKPTVAVEKVVSNKRKFDKISSTSNNTSTKCKHCGRPHPGQCKLATHPDANKTELSWDKSTNGIAWKKKGFDYLPFNKTLSGETYKPDNKEREGKSDLDVVASMLTDNVKRELLPTTLMYNNISLPILTLLDTGALQSNYLSERLAKEMQMHISGPEVNISSALNNVDSLRSKGNSQITVVYFNELTKIHEPIVINVTILDIPFDLIIGKPTLKQYKILRKVHDQFWGTSDMTEVEEESEEVHLLLGSHESLLATQLIAQLQDRDEILSWENDDPEIYEPDQSNLPLDIGNLDESMSKIPIEIHGDEELKEQLTSLCHQYEEIFSREVRPTPADIPPFELDVDLNKWQRNANRISPRPMTINKQLELRQQIDKLIKLKVIERSNAIYYSQVHLVPKPNNKWRFCLDYRNLNDATEFTSAWPIPNIEQCVNRIGSNSPQYFGIMDLTSGYHQAPLGAASQALSAFICFMGVYQWLRVPMGLKGAPSYFQEQLATVVLAGILYIVCELYLDDVIVYGQTKEEFVQRLKDVFERFRKYNITINPDKVTLGVNQIEYVGHLLTNTGQTFSKEKIDSVLNFVLPINVTNLQSFIGLVNYFSAHLKNFTSLVKPLREMIPDNSKANSKQLLNWSPVTTAAFNNVVEEVRNIPMLYFLNPNEPIYLETDACEYGVGAYLYQIIGNEQRPIRFISKALTGAQLNWSTPEKEAYAIFFSITKLEHLLRDVKFILQTDHKNLTFIDKGKGKILRWKLALQEYNFSINHIPGQDNIVADGLSRLCALHPEDFIHDSFEIPADLYKILAKVHNTNVGHFGEELTLKRVIETGQTMPYIREYVKRFIKQCPCCQKTTKLRIPINVQKFTTSTYRTMQCLNIDTIGPLPLSAGGFQYIFVIIDTFTRWVEIYPLQSTAALPAAKCLIQQLGRFGIPSVIRSDRGSQFVNEIIKSLFTLLNIEHQLSIAYSKEENAIVERAN
jgi:hypothetical protein